MATEQKKITLYVSSRLPGLCDLALSNLILRPATSAHGRIAPISRSPSSGSNSRKSSSLLTVRASSGTLMKSTLYGRLFPLQPMTPLTDPFPSSVASSPP